MNRANEPRDLKTPTLGEVALAMLIISSLILGQLAVSKSFFLFGRNFWSDK
jgi:hypothetical protein